MEDDTRAVMLATLKATSDNVARLSEGARLQNFAIWALLMMHIDLLLALADKDMLTAPDIVQRLDRLAGVVGADPDNVEAANLIRSIARALPNVAQKPAQGEKQKEPQESAEAALLHSLALWKPTTKQ